MYSCALEKKVPNGKKLLTKNEIVVDGKNEKSEIAHTDIACRKADADERGVHARTLSGDADVARERQREPAAASSTLHE